MEKNSLLRPFTLEGLECLEMRSDHSLPLTPKRYDVLLLLDPKISESCETLFARARELLKPEGVILLALKNPFALSQWNGTVSSERPFLSLCGKTTSNSLTKTRKEIEPALNRFDLSVRESFFIFPSVEAPRLIADSSLLDKAPALLAEMAASVTEASNPLFPEVLCQQRLVEAGIFKDFVPAEILVISSEESILAADKVLFDSRAKGEIAWYTPKERRIDTETTVTSDNRGIAFHKRCFETNPAKLRLFSDKGFSVEWKSEGRAPWLAEKKFLTLWYEKGYFESAESCFDFLAQFLSWSFEQNSENEFVAGASIDALATNAAVEVSANGVPVAFKIFDKEWSLEDPFRKSWFILRNLLALSRHQAVLDPVPENFVEAWYEKLCSRFGVKARLREDLEWEASFQELVTINPVSYHDPIELIGVFAPRYALQAYPRHSVFGARDQEILQLRKRLELRRYRIADRLATFWKSLFNLKSLPKQTSKTPAI